MHRPQACTPGMQLGGPAPPPPLLPASPSAGPHAGSRPDHCTKMPTSFLPGSRLGARAAAWGPKEPHRLLCAAAPWFPQCCAAPHMPSPVPTLMPAQEPPGLSLWLSSRVLRRPPGAAEVPHLLPPCKLSPQQAWRPELFRRASHPILRRGGPGARPQLCLPSSPALSARATHRRSCR